MAAIAIDLGEKKVGIAIEVNGIAIPKKIVSRIELVRELKKFFEENFDYDEIIVGLPFDLYGIDSRQLDKTKKFIKKLENIFSEKKVIGFDERYSTIEARNLKTGKSEIDDISASLILESYLKNREKM